MSTSLKWTQPGGSKSGLFVSGWWVDLIGEDVIDERFCDGEIEADQQLVQALAFAADEHGQAVMSVRGGGNAAYGFDDADGDVAEVDQVGDVGQGRAVLVYAASSFTGCRLRAKFHGKSSSIRVMG